MTAQLTVLTGASRGMGLAIARELLVRHHILLCISRRSNEALAEEALLCGALLTQWEMDLADGSEVARRLRQWLAQHDAARLAGATLINNAGVIPPLVPLDQSDPEDLAWALRVGLEAPMQLSAAFLGATRNWTAPRRVLNVSSGLGRRAMASQSAYCAAKAGMDHFSRCLALDEARKANGAKVCSLAPGVIDTDMQTQLRQAAGSEFPDQANFANMHARGHLSSAKEAARLVLAYLNRPDFGELPVADVRD
jgi:NAD(P)-dependent dehydrogenase (short-subunit alcohol dehydrogenase family)